jgi:acetylornithine deacetylase/succinyl-diaminopimelate desuccinylase-like protein
MAVVTAHREQLPLKRDVLLAVVCDEESGGQYGAEYLADNHPNEVAAAWCLNEGGSGWKMGELRAMLCAFAEKGPLWVRLTAEGRSGHGSMPHGENPCEHVVAAANALLEMPKPIRVLPEMQVFLERFGMGGISSDALESQPMFKLPNVQAMFHDTMSLTMLNAGARPNVIPDKAEATMDLRILPDRKNKEVVEELWAALPEGPVRIETLMSVDASSSAVDNDLFECVERLSERFFPEVPFVHTICPGFTDSRCFRRLGTICCGWAPAMIDAEDLSRMHGKDERIKIADLGLGIQVMYEMIKDLCGR